MIYVQWLSVGCLLALLGGVAGCAVEEGEQTAAAEEVTVLTFNVWHDQQDWSRRRDHIVAELREMEPDVVCLQEVLQHAELPNQARTLADSLGYRYTFASVDSAGSVKRYGNAVLTPHPITAEGSYPLEPKDDFRVAAHTRVQAGDQLLDVYCTHLHYSGASGGDSVRRTQVRDLATLVDSTSKGAAVVAGDFNTRPDAPELALLTPRFRDAYAGAHPDLQGEGPTTLNPHAGHTPRRIDYVFAESDRFEPLEARVIFDEPGTDSLWASDHFGVLARLAWSGGSSN